MDGSSKGQGHHELRVPVSSVRPDKSQPRTYFKESALRSLARSIKSRGQRTPIQVRVLPTPEDGCLYEIIDGERRWRAHQIAGVSTIRISIEEGEPDARERHLLSLISNHHREGHTHMEISCALQYQVDLKQKVSVIAESLDKSPQWVYQYLSLQQLVPELQEKMHPETDDKELLRFGEAVVLASLPAEQQLGVYKQMLKSPLRYRLDLARRCAEKITGEKRKGRHRDVRRHAQRFFQNLSAEMDILLDMKGPDFAKIISGSSMAELRLLKEQLSEGTKQLQSLVLCIDDALTIR